MPRGEGGGGELEETQLESEWKWPVMGAKGNGTRPPCERPVVGRSLKTPATQVAFVFHNEKVVTVAQVVPPIRTPSSLHHVVRWQTQGQQGQEGCSIHRHGRR